MRLFVFLAGLLLTGIAASGRSQAQDVPECVVPLESEMRANMLALPSATAAKREEPDGLDIGFRSLLHLEPVHGDEHAPS